MDGWDANAVNDEKEVRPASNTCVIINGSSIPVSPGSSMVETVKRMALDAGYGKFRVFINNAEIKPSEAPALINENDKIEIRPYDKAG